MPIDTTEVHSPFRALPVDAIDRPSNSSSSRVDDEVELRELWFAVWRSKWFVIAVTTLFAVAGAFYAISLPNIYRSQALLAPSDDAQGRGISGMAGQLGGLATLAGIHLGSGRGADKVAVAMAVMTSRSFITSFIDRYGLLPELLAVERWDRQENVLVFNPDLYMPNSQKWVRRVDPPLVPEPSLLEGYSAFMEILLVVQDKETGFVTVALDHYSPFVAERWVRLLVEDVNSVMKDKDVTEAQRSVDFLQKQLSRVALAEMRTVFYQLIEEQTKTIMLAEVRDEYVFSTIDPPVVAEVKAKPNRPLICVLAVLFGGTLAVLLVLLRYLAARRPVDTPAKS